MSPLLRKVALIGLGLLLPFPFGGLSMNPKMIAVAAAAVLLALVVDRYVGVSSLLA